VFEEFPDESVFESKAILAQLILSFLLAVAILAVIPHFGHMDVVVLVLSVILLLQCFYPCHRSKRAKGLLLNSTQHPVSTQRPASTQHLTHHPESSIKTYVWPCMLLWQTYLLIVALLASIFLTVYSLLTHDKHGTLLIAILVSTHRSFECH
jgi:hypothetical protein